MQIGVKFALSGVSWHYLGKVITIRRCKLEDSEGGIGPNLAKFALSKGGFGPILTKLAS